MTLSIVRPVVLATGVEFRLLSTRWSLVSFQAPSEEGGAVVLRICGGLLVQKQPCCRGELRFAVEAVPTGAMVLLQLSGYSPLMLGSPPVSVFRYWLFRLTQSAIHRLATVRFLTMLYRDLGGSSACVRVVDGQVRNGRPL